MARPACFLRLVDPSRCFGPKVDYDDNDLDATGAPTAGLAFPDLDWSDTPGRHARVCARLLFLVGPRLMFTVALVDGWDRDLPDLPSPVDASQLCCTAQVA